MLGDDSCVMNVCGEMTATREVGFRKPSNKASR